MIIDRIELKNYRSHEDSLVVFGRGINLLLGRNGSGKTSVLEALGFVLLNIPPREGGNNTYAFKRKGTDFSSIRVDFTGNDLQKYTVMRDMRSNKSIKLYKNDDLIADSIGESVYKIKEIAGINGDEKSVFSNIITAAQNEIISVFKQRQGDRRKLFNEIFEIDIYDEMAEKFCKKYLAKLNSERVFYEGQVYEIKPGVETIPDKRKELEEHEEKLSPLNEEIKKYESLLKSLKKAIDDADELLRRKNIKEEIKGEKEKSLKSDERSFHELKAELESAERSKTIVQKNLEIHIKYESLREKENEMSEEEAKLLENEKDYFQLDKDINELNTRIKNGEQNCKSLLEEIGEFKKSGFADYFSRYENNKREIELSARNEEEYDKEMLKDLLEKTEKTGIELERNITNIENSDNQKNRLAGEITAGKHINDEIEKIDAELRNLYKKNEMINRTLSIRNGLNFNLKNLIDSKEKLSGGLCPLLNEECLNIKGRGDPDSYFKPKIDGINQELEKLIYSEKDKEKNEERINFLRGGRIKKENLLELIENKKNQVEEINKMQDKMRTRRFEINVELERILKSLKTITIEDSEISGFTTDEKDREIINRIKKKINEVIQSIKIMEHNIHIQKNKKTEILRDIKNRAYEFFKKYEGLKKTEKNLIDLKKNIELKTVAFEIKKIEYGKLQKVRGRLKGIRKEINELSGGEKLYRDNVHNAGRAEELYKKVGSFSKKIEEEEKELKRYDEEIKRMNAEFKGMRYEELKEKETETSDILDIKKEKRVTLESKIDILKSDYKKLKDQEKHLKEINKKIKTIGSKEELLSEFRKNLKTLGQKIAERFRNDISSRATLNYNKISGLEERIIWDETYGIKLLSAIDNMERDFTNLSGGEQVAVALCVRAALASVFSNAKIAIFDEPTQNLDRETREKLSETLNILFKDLEQTFIVSHENDFMEMASKTIHFEKISGKTVVEEYE